jgi:hypothetical protein
VTAVVLDALAGARDPALRAFLGAAIDDELRRVLRARATAWAERAVAAGDGACGHGAVLEVGGSDELAEALAGRVGPVLLVAPDVPGLADAHCVAALDDLGAGVLLSSGASGDGTPFLVALARPEPALVALVGAPFDEVAAGAVALGGELGMLRTERRLTSVADARAVRVDPLAPPELRALLAAALG